MRRQAAAYRAMASSALQIKFFVIEIFSNLEIAKSENSKIEKTKIRKSKLEIFADQKLDCDTQDIDAMK
jgi:hypothetical protein